MKMVRLRLNQCDEINHDEGKDFVALYVGDWDPSGLHMSEVDLPERLQRYRRIIVPNAACNADLSRLTHSELAALEAKLDNVDFTIKRIALLEDDLEDLPSFPLESKMSTEDKKGDTRAPWYKENYHPTKCWELDAMNPRALRARVESEIVRYIDQELWERVEEGERAERESIRQFADSLKSLPRRY